MTPPTVSVSLSVPGVPVLPTRKTSEVISELRESASTNIVSTDFNEQHSNKAAKSRPGASDLLEAAGVYSLSAGVINSDRHGSNQEGDEGELEYGDEEEEELQPTTQRKVTQRKRRLNAIADNYAQERNRRLAAEDTRFQLEEDNANRSTKWLINQSEAREIISSPRDYQVELFERAKEKNIIAVLDTGSGKTLIAVLLLRHVFSQELENRALGKPKRISFFLVDSVQLVFQQHAVLKANLDQPMDMFCGDMGCDLWKKELWDEHFAKNMVIVCTAEVLRQCLHHSFISMDRINLLIFDEAHHAKKDHSYARIIKDFYVQQSKFSPLPKIFGMTASPVDARVDVKKAAAELEAILHCQIATAKDLNLLQYTIASKQEQLAKYAVLGPKFQTSLYKEMHNRFKSNPVLAKPLVFALDASRELGSWCSDQVWPLCLTEEESKKLQARTERRYHARKCKQPLEVLEQHKAEIKEARQILEAHVFDPPDYRAESGGSENLSPKVTLLIRYLKERFERPTDDKCIVFVRQRYTARLLAKLFTEPGIGTPYLLAGALVGTRSGDAGDLNVSFREQVLTMMNFRKGVINCLFATSVAEEGLDIPDCNLVIRFDLYTTLIQYIQSRGRARHRNSRYIHMCEDGNQEHSQIIREVRQNEHILKGFCNALPEDRLLSGNDYNMDYFLAKEKTHRVYITPRGAKLNYKMSLLVLSNFVSSLPRKQGISYQVEYVVTVQNKQFLCEVILPECSPIRGSIGRLSPTKQVAKCSAAFDTCLELIKNKYLDDNLIPTYTRQLPIMRNALLAVNSKKREEYEMKAKPELWAAGGITKTLFLTVLNLEWPEDMGRPFQPLAILTRSALPQFPSFFLHFGSGRHSPAQCTSIAQPLHLEDGTLKQINSFTLCIFNDVFSKEYEPDISKMPYFLAPIIRGVTINPDADPTRLIDWDTLKTIEDYNLKWLANHWDNKSWQTEPDEFFRNKFVVDPYDGSRKLWTTGVTQDYKPLDPVPNNTAPRAGTRKDNNNIMEYSCSLWPKARAERTFDPTQRVIEVEYIPLRRNLLDDFETTEDEIPKKCFVILEPLKISPLPATVVAMAYLFPAIIHRVESYLIALEACNLLHLEIRLDLALEAITKDSENSDEHGSQQINFQRGMGNNYERLEFLGDCFLKMATSISLFGIHPDNDEYSYHVDRMLLICNKNLKNNAIKLKLYTYIRSMSFSRRAWYPEGLVIKRGKTTPAPKSHRLCDKTIADVCEALIGAALLNSHATKDMDNAVRAVTEFVSSENHQATSFADYYKLYNLPEYQTAPSTAIQRDLAYQLEQKHPYHFRYPRLARSAFTHPSYPYSYERVPSYQRLEFIGDALLDMACVNFLFHSYPGKDPQWLTEHKMAMVSNQFLGALCVSLEVHTHLLLFNSSFRSQIDRYIEEITEARKQAEDDAVRAGKSRQDCSPDYWVQVRQPPKCLPDIVEAYIGAIFVDSEYNYEEVEKFFDMHIKWYFNDISVYDTYANKHPTTFLTHFLQTNMGCVDWSVICKEIKDIDGTKPKVLAMVVIHDKVVADALAESSRYAKVAAAKKALTLLSGLPLMEFRGEYGCSCVQETIITHEPSKSEGGSLKRGEN